MRCFFFPKGKEERKGEKRSFFFLKE